MSHFERDKLHAFGYQGGNKDVQQRFHFIVDHDLQALDQKVTKHSPTLGRDATYSQKSRLERLPTYLTVHMVRFAWREDIGKKVKILVSELSQQTHKTLIIFRVFLAESQIPDGV